MALLRTLTGLLTDLISLAWGLSVHTVQFLVLCRKSEAALSAEVLFLRKQLAYYQERQIQARRFDNASRYLMVLLSRLFDWRGALVVVKPETLIAWHRAGFRLFWRWKSKCGRRPIPLELRALIRQMAKDNVSWGEERIANELRLKLGIRVSPRTVRKYMPKRPPGQPRGDQRWRTFIHNHAHAIVACDFLTVVTATFNWLYVFVVVELGTRKLLHVNATAHPTAAWTLQQLREALPSDHNYHFLLHDRDNIFSAALDASVNGLRLKILKSPYRAPTANAICERLNGTLRRECLDYLIPLNERHICQVLKSWKAYYNALRPHMSLGPDIPSPPETSVIVRAGHRHRFPENQVVAARPILGGLHHDYQLVPVVALGR